MKKSLISAALTLAILSAWVSAGCGDDGAPASPTEGVVIESISPASASLGAEVVIRGSGFAAENNDVGFTNPEIDFQGRHTGYLNGLPSSDGKTLRFNLADNENVLLAACAFSQLKTNEACPDIGLLLPLGDSEVIVTNENGTSNSVTISVTGP
jgi:hypothetical protein